jgi:hypothetical protein
MILEVIGRPLRYRTRHLKPGDTFSCVDLLAKVYIRKGAAVPYAPPAARPTPPRPEEADERVALRAEYFAKVGKRPFYGWDADTLRQKIAEGG